jgi:lipoprotein-anchoring transpeptidase ErfK/SrfK
VGSSGHGEAKARAERHADRRPGNPLGARVLELGDNRSRIHGTNAPKTIGTNVAFGCIRLVNDDIVDLYGRVRVGTPVLVN